MALNIKDRRTDELAREVAALTHQGITEALRETLELRVVELRTAHKAREAEIEAAITEMQQRIAAAPVRDTRSLKEISDGLWDDSE
ncbi:hypothetical protein BH10PSE1_BH10PSE1_00770 [soil metagenome]